jgi:drug/metabolite transporter (DMT)-like permease
MCAADFDCRGFDCGIGEVNRLLSTPLFLLIGTGIGLGLLAPLGTLANRAGFNPFLWIGMIMLVPGLLLLFLARNENWQRSDLLSFGIIAGLFANVIPNSILLTAMPHIGTGLGGLMFALSPVVTAVLSIAFRVRPPNRALMVSVALGFVGAVLIVAGRNSLALPSAPTWLLIALLMPVSLAIGNVYRTAYWPKDATPLQTGAASNLLSVPPLIALAFWQDGGIDLAPFLSNWPLSLAQCVASIIMYLLFFRLQWVGGPTYLSQIGYIAAALGLAVGTFVFHETYPAIVWIGAAFILSGILITILEKRLIAAH